ncbi:hypothetical protein Apa02nite_010860 [Actinoplanes palleronii]|uniref:Uncharacterized protein n=1 Tax=Actinoplanes palleronii TaxID=113570 RepID=A0ABQ4B2T2_9ACTN|nr:hypothetical protein Apa02nite_010860 [Actinoplanes palleronii]
MATFPVFGLMTLAVTLRLEPQGSFRVLSLLLSLGFTFTAAAVVVVVTVVAATGVVAVAAEAGDVATS